MANDKTGWSRGLDRPVYAETGSDSAFWFSPDAEALFAAEGILGASTFFLYRSVFGDEKIEYYRLKYKLVSEIRSSFERRAGSPSVFECLQGFDIRDFTLSSFRDHIRSLDKAKLPGVLLGMPVSSIEDLVQANRELFSNYLGAAAYFTFICDFVEGIFALAEDLQTDAFYGTLDRYRRNIEEAQKSSLKELAAMTPLEYSDKLMQINLWRRGAYSFFAFAPSVFSGSRAVRYIDTEQFLFYAIDDAVYENEQMLRQLKALADDTRFRIVALLKEHGGLKSSNVAKIMGLSTSAVSRHLKILREAGIVREETVGAIKLYSLPTSMAQEITESLKEFLDYA